MNVRAKFKCWSVVHGNSPNPDDVYAQVQMQAAYGTEGDNAMWSKYTPSATLTMSITNPSAIEAFEPGKEYYVDFTPVD